MMLTNNFLRRKSYYILYFTGYFGRQVHISTIYVGLQIKIGGGYEATEKMAKIHLKK